MFGIGIALGEEVGVTYVLVDTEKEEIENYISLESLRGFRVYFSVLLEQKVEALVRGLSGGERDVLCENKIVRTRFWEVFA